jgi:hypothetical protein
MTDLFLGQTCSYATTFEYDAGGAYTFTFPWQPDKVAVYNYTSWADTGAEPASIWFRGMPAGDALQWQRIIADGGSAGNLLLETTNGFTQANTTGGVTAYRADISGVTQADPCVITTSAAHGYSTGQIVRITDLGDVGPNATARGMNQLNNNRYKIVVLTTTTFSLQDPVSGEDIDSSAYTAYVSGGRVVLETRVIGDPEAYAYLDVVYRLTLGTAVFGGASDGDIFYMEALKYGEWEDLGDLANLR